MRHTVFPLALALSFFAAERPALADENPWESLVGCYSTISLNGASIHPAPGKPTPPTRITKDPAEDFTRLDGNQIPSVRIMLSAGYQPSFHGFGFHEESVFLGMGTVGGENGSLTYHFQGRVLSPPWGNKETELDESVEAAPLTGQQLQIHVKRKSSVAGDKFDRDNIWVLSPVVCP